MSSTVARNGSGAVGRPRVVHFDPINPPDAVMNLCDVLDLVECGVEAMRSLLDASPLDADELANVAELFAYEVIIEDEVMGVVDLADEAVAQ